MTIMKKKNTTKNTLKRSCLSFVLCFILMLTLAVLNGISVSTTGSSPETMNEKHQFSKTHKRIPALTNGDAIELIQKGYLHLVDIDLTHFPFSDRNNGQSPYRASGRFCHLEFSKHKADPASVPMFKDLVQQSPACKRSAVTVDLHTAVMAAREYDKKYSGDRIKSMPPRGFVFHESRCGSTLVANSLASFEPSKNRVYSESGPPIAAIKAFDLDHEEESIQFIQDTIYLMGRTVDMNEENLFFKVQSIGSKSIWAFRKAFPTTPWIYLYRDPVQVMKSHLKKQGTTRAVCLRSQKRPSADVVKLVRNVSGLKPSDLSTEQICAAHLATLCEAAEKEIQDSNGLGRFVNYVELPDVLIDDIIPKHFLHQEGELSPDAKQRINDVNQKYSKGRDTNKAWKEDSKNKEETAWKEMKDAAAEYMLPVYERMEAIRTGR